MADGMMTRLARPEDVPEVLEVLKAALGVTTLLRRTPELWRWKHEVNPFGPSIVLIAETGGRIAGVRALMRWELNHRGETIRCARPVDTATHPDYVRRGIFRRLTLEALEVAETDGVHLVFNTPNPQSGAGYLDMGWGEVGTIGVLVRPRIGPTVTFRDGEQPQTADLIPEGMPFQPMMIADRPSTGLRTRRDDAYQTWRFTSHPTAQYVSVDDPGGGSAVVRAGVRGARPELVLSDLLGGAGRTAVRRAGSANRARYLAGWFSKGSPERRAAIAGGMLPVPGLKALRLVAKPLTQLSVDIFDLSSWDLATSDLELL